MVESEGRFHLHDLCKRLIYAEVSSRVSQLSPWKHRDEEREASGQRVSRDWGQITRNDSTNISRWDSVVETTRMRKTKKLLE